MAANTEEVRIKLGVDGSAVSSGLAGLQTVVSKFAHNVTNSLGHLLKVNLASMFGGNIIELWDKGTQKLAALIYNVRALGEAQRQQRRQDYQDFLKQMEAENQMQIKRIKDRDTSAKTLGEAARVDRQRQLLAEKDESRREAMKRKFLHEELKALRDSLNVRGDIVEQSQIQLAIAQKELEVANAQNASDERKLALKNAIADAESGVKDAKGNLASGLRSLSDTSLGDANAITDRALGAQNLPDLQLSRPQMNDIRQANLLQRQAQQARINGDGKRADELSQKRLDLLKRNPWMSDIDRNPLKVAEEQLLAAQELLNLAKSKGLAVTVKVSKQ